MAGAATAASREFDCKAKPPPRRSGEGEGPLWPGDPVYLNWSRIKPGQEGTLQGLPGPGGGDSSLEFPICPRIATGCDRAMRR